MWSYYCGLKIDHIGLKFLDDALIYIVLIYCFYDLIKVMCQEINPTYLILEGCEIVFLYPTPLSIC
jgi:hypothetical protein